MSGWTPAGTFQMNRVETRRKTTVDFMVWFGSYPVIKTCYQPMNRGATGLALQLPQLPARPQTSQ